MYIHAATKASHTFSHHSTIAQYTLKDIIIQWQLWQTNRSEKRAKAMEIISEYKYHIESNPYAYIWQNGV